ncbi:uncharacterized protein LOC143846638 [Tasmannia lanceolata]|uniref:uncharacterized protein LOC143846638 n=1 Tax=Tasmannia lanceolata TaxID=3420 RepID=UPI004062C9DA
MYRGKSQPSTPAGRKNLERFKDKGKFDNVVVIDVDKGKSHDVVIIDVPESSRQRYRSSRASRTNKRCPFRGIIIIDDEDIGNNDGPRSGEYGDLDSDATPSKKFCPTSGQSHVSHESDGENYQIFNQKRKFPIKLSKCMQKYPGKRPFGNSFGSSESDSSDCELMEGSSGKIREHWEKAALRKKLLDDIHSNRFGVEDRASASGLNTGPRNSSEETPPKIFDIGNNAGATHWCTYEQSVQSSSSNAGSEKDSFSPCKGCNPVADSDLTVDQNGHERAGFVDKEEQVVEKPSFCKIHSYDEVQFKQNCAGFRDREKIVPVEPSLCNTQSRNDLDVDHNGPGFLDKEESYCGKPSSSNGHSWDEAQVSHERAYWAKEGPFPVEPSLCNAQLQNGGQVNCESTNCHDEKITVSIEPYSCNSKSHDETQGNSGKVTLEGREELGIGESSSCGPQPQDETPGKSAGTTSGLPGIQNDLIGEREKHKKTDEFRRASEEEWASRQKQLQIQAEEVQRLRKKKKAETLRLLDMERRQKKRLEEIWESQKKDEETINLKEQLRVEIRKELDKLELIYRDMASLLRALGIHVGGGLYPMSREVNAAYKQALLKFHPDRASKSDIRQQVIAEETFKLISHLKEKLLPSEY